MTRPRTVCGGCVLGDAGGAARRYDATMRKLLILSALLAVTWLGWRLFRDDSAPIAGADTAPAVATATGAADPAGLARADSLVAAWVHDERVPGAVLLVSSGGRPVLREAYGWAQLYDFGEGQYRPVRASEDGAGPSRERLRRLEEPRAMTAETVFDLASVTKVAATTMAVMLLVDRGLLDVDDPVVRHLPDFRGGGKERITLRQLLTHTSGLYQWQPVYYHAADADAAYAYVRDLPLAWDVGAGRHYSDLGFMLLGRIVESVSGRTLGAFLQDELYGPLGLEAIGFRGSGRTDGRALDRRPFAATSHGNPYEHRMVHDSTFGYRYEGDPFSWDGWRRRTLVGEVNDGNSFHAFGGEAGHAGLFAGADELRSLLELLLDGGTYQGRRFIDAEVVAAFLTPQVEGQALGWQVPPWAPDGSFSHTGFTGTFVLGVPGRQLAVVLLTNRQNLGLDGRTRLPDVGPLQRSVAEALLGGG